MYKISPATHKYIDYISETTRRLSQCLLVIALVPLKCSSRKLQRPHRVFFSQGEKALMPLFKNEASIKVCTCADLASLANGMGNDQGAWRQSTLCPQ